MWDMLVDGETIHIQTFETYLSGGGYLCELSHLAEKKRLRRQRRTGDICLQKRAEGSQTSQQNISAAYII